PRSVGVWPNRQNTANDMRRLNVVEPMLVKRFANDLHDALELRSRGLVPHVGLIGLPPFLCELAEQARSLSATLLLVAVLSRIRPLRQQPQGVNRLVLGLGELQAGRL